MAESVSASTAIRRGMSFPACVFNAVPIFQPALHLLDLSTLRRDDILAKLLKFAVLRFLEKFLAHCDGHLVVIDHLRHESNFRIGFRLPLRSLII